jgi:cystathionine gamma-synthase
MRVERSQVVAVFFDKKAYWTARLFWQHTGFGISSRLADHILSLLDRESEIELLSSDLLTQSLLSRSVDLNGGPILLDSEFDPKAAMRAYISKLISAADCMPHVAVSESDVFLYPTGMNAMWNVHQLCMDVLGKEPPTVCFGYATIASNVFVELTAVEDFHIATRSMCYEPLVLARATSTRKARMPLLTT